MPWNLYILHCDQKTYYIGITSNLDTRVESHRRMRNIATKEFSDFELVYTEQYITRQEVENRERQLKRWTFEKKKALVDGNIELLKVLSKNREVVKGHGEK